MPWLWCLALLPACGTGNRGNVQDRRGVAALETHSSSGRYVLEIRPHLDDPFKSWSYTLRDEGEAVWSQRVNWSAQHVAAGDQGRVAIAVRVPGWRAPSGDDEWRLYLFDDTGRVKLLERIAAESSGCMQSSPGARLWALGSHQGLDRVSIALQPNAGWAAPAQLWSFRLSTGERLLDAPLPRPPRQPAGYQQVEALCEVPGTPLTVVHWKHWWRDAEDNRHDGETVQLFDRRQREIWSEDLPPISEELVWQGVCRRTVPGPPGQFAIESPSAGTRKVYRVGVNPEHETGWSVSSPMLETLPGPANLRASELPVAELEELTPIPLRVNGASLAAGQLALGADGSVRIFDTDRGEVRTFLLDGSELSQRLAAGSGDGAGWKNRLVLSPLGSVFMQRRSRRDDWVGFDGNGSNRRHIKLGGTCAAFLAGGRRLAAMDGRLQMFDRHGVATHVTSARPDGKPLRQIHDVVVSIEGRAFLFDGRQYSLGADRANSVLCEYSSGLEARDMWTLPSRAFPALSSIRLSVSESHVLMVSHRSRTAYLLDRRARVLKTLTLPEELNTPLSLCLGPELDTLWVLESPAGVIRRLRIK